MKRFFALILALVIALSLFACGSKDDGEPLLPLRSARLFLPAMM